MDIENLRCKKCLVNNTYTTLKERVCKRCGYREKLKKRKKKDKELIQTK